MSKVLTKTTPVTEILNKQVANWSVLYAKLHNFHWYVKGENFFTLHIKFEELYTEAGLHLDVVAERILSLQSKPTATLKEHLALSSIKEAKGNESATQMVAQVIEDFETIAKELTQGIEAAEEQKDQPSADMMIQIRTSLEKHIWMLGAYLA
ncbi:DNA starvation/stationary phase protection protein [Paenibacillus psychroresistens]|uniref:DNA starvation/stationary phase protection protein n=1 Tax=Paenibacillus psychroresistens TaxID=1778678 RepID=A0A6B8RT57_9BACL|nr:DNA starvation/stationary phase protection protein [Paenibacillus psychroresistens]QGQ98633.1 DNA starvation/stationary phase protection protein [Paenibacillus psychroresistens]